MQYYVIGADGNRYGPGDMQTLRQWVAESRLTPQTMLEDFDTGQRVPASTIGALFEGQQVYHPMASYQEAPAPGPANYPRYVGNMYDNGSSELTSSFIWTALAFVCLPIIGPIVGLHYGNKAAMKGNPSAQGARIFAIVVLCLHGAILLLYLVLFIVMLAAGGLNSTGALGF
jgi:hypothetical protein